MTAADVREHFEANTLLELLFEQVGLAMVGQASGGSIVMLGDGRSIVRT